MVALHHVVTCTLRAGDYIDEPGCASTFMTRKLTTLRDFEYVPYTVGMTEKVCQTKRSATTDDQGERRLF